MLELIHFERLKKDGRKCKEKPRDNLTFMSPPFFVGGYTLDHGNVIIKYCICWKFPPCSLCISLRACWGFTSDQLRPCPNRLSPKLIATGSLAERNACNLRLALIYERNWAATPFSPLWASTMCFPLPSRPTPIIGICGRPKGIMGSMDESIRFLGF